MEIVVCCINTKWQETEHHPWELITRVTVDGFDEANEAPDHAGKEVDVFSEDEKTAEGRKYARGNEFNWVNIRTRNAYWVDEAVMPFMDVLVKR